MEATTGFEPVIGALQAPALPLGYVASLQLLKRPVKELGADILYQLRQTLYIHRMECCQVSFQGWSH